jgi:hypothetical protein
MPDRSGDAHRDRACRSWSSHHYAPRFWLEINGITAPTFSRSALNVKLADFDEFEVGALRAT